MPQIGDNIKCTKTHSMGAVIKGNAYPLLGIRRGAECNCYKGDLLYNVGIQRPSKHSPYIGELVLCSSCNMTYNWTGIWWIDSNRFAEEYSIPRTAAIEQLLNLPIVKEKLDVETVKQV